MNKPWKYVAFEDLNTPQNATQMNKPGKYVAFEELGGFTNIGKDLGRFPFVGMVSLTGKIKLSVYHPPLPDPTPEL